MWAQSKNELQTNNCLLLLKIITLESQLWITEVNDAVNVNMLGMVCGKKKKPKNKLAQGKEYFKDAAEITPKWGWVNLSSTFTKLCKEKENFEGEKMGSA